MKEEIQQKENRASADSIFISLNEMQAVFYKILQQLKMPEADALLCAETFANNSLDGVYTHGVNRFSRFVKNIKDGIVKLNVKPQKISGFGGLEQWNGMSGAGTINATAATDIAMNLASQNGISCVTLSNTNHWMRGGTYGWQAATKGFVFIGWTNTIANMPAWKAIDNRLGNNPIVLAIPYEKNAIVLDMAMSQFSFGSMELAAMKSGKLSVPGGFDANGKLTDDPNAIIKSKRPLPVGYWKGAGLSLLLDILATVLSGGLSTAKITASGEEQEVSQVFICIDLKKLPHFSSIPFLLKEIITDYKGSIAENEKDEILYPGERVLATRKKNLIRGIPVLKDIWQQIKALENNH